jgi:hypothetical protein
MGGVCSKHGERRGAYRVLAGRREEKRTLGKPRCSWKDNIKMNFLKVGSGIDVTDLAQHKSRWRAFAKAVMNFRVP